MWRGWLAKIWYNQWRNMAKGSGNPQWQSLGVIIGWRNG